LAGSFFAVFSVAARSPDAWLAFAVALVLVSDLFACFGLVLGFRWSVFGVVGVSGFVGSRVLPLLRFLGALR